MNTKNIIIAGAALLSAVALYWHIERSDASDRKRSARQTASFVHEHETDIQCLEVNLKQLRFNLSHAEDAEERRDIDREIADIRRQIKDHENEIRRAKLRR